MFCAGTRRALVAVAAILLGANATPAAEAGSLAMDSSVLAAAPAPVANALRANVRVETVFADGRRSVGSGVIIAMRDGKAEIATARHVVEPGLAGRSAGARPSSLTIVAIDTTRAPGTVEWIAPHGIDLAIVSAPLAGVELRPACRIKEVATNTGAAVFAVGNPGGTGSTHVRGTLMQVREQRQDGYQFQMLQSQLPLGSGYSGGGLYDEEGRLIGIHSMATAPLGDPRVAGGIGLSTSLATLIALAPERFGVGSDVEAGAGCLRQTPAK
jgi:serine protease Do